MSTRPDPDLVIASWLRDEARDGASDRLLAATRRQLESTNQRRAWLPAWRFRQMNTALRVAFAAAAVAVVAVAGLSLMPKQGGVGGHSPAPSSSPTSSPASSPTSLLRDGSLAAGTYLMRPFGTSVSFTLTVPAGWQAVGSAVFPSATGSDSPDGMGLAVVQAGGLYSDPCHGTSADIAVGPSVDDLATALARQTMYQASPPAPVTLSGFSGIRMDIQVPSDVDLATCTNNGGDPSVGPGQGGYFLWQSAEPGAMNIYAQGPGNRFHLWILDVEGTRAIVLTEDFAGTSEANRVALQAVVDSIRIEP